MLTKVFFCSPQLGWGQSFDVNRDCYRLLLLKIMRRRRPQPAETLDTLHEPSARPGIHKEASEPADDGVGET